MEIKDLFLSTSTYPDNHVDSQSDNTDVVVELDNGNRYVAAFFAYKNIEKLIQENEKSGEYLNGKYFYVHNMILINQCSEENIREVVQHLIDEGEFLLLFKRISK